MALEGDPVSMYNISRRGFIRTTSLSAAALLMDRTAFAQASGATLHLDTKSQGHLISPDFIGLSYETMQLEDAAFFSPRNKSLVEQFRAISPKGVLRLGGNTSEFEWWKATSAQAAPDRNLVLRDGSRPSPTIYAVTPESVQELDGFLLATGWSCIYGLNLGYGTPETDIPEAKFVFETLGPRLQYFQVGNEVDNFAGYRLRDKDTWNVDTYLEQWLRIARAVQVAIPAARFGMPDVASRVEWLTAIADKWVTIENPPTVSTLSHHYYWSGPPSNPNATIERLLKSDPRVLRDCETARAAAAKMGAAYRMTEGNTVHHGGKSGLSDVFASALWGADYLLTLMRLGYSGVNLHGGSGHAQAISVGGTFVGEAEMKDPNQPHPKPFYTPIANEGTLAGSGVNGKLNDTYVLEPVGFGMKFVSPFAGTTMLPVEFQPGEVNAAAYAARRSDGQILLAVINKDNKALILDLPPGDVFQVLTAPALTSSSAQLLTGPAARSAVPRGPGPVVIPKTTGVSFLLT